MKEQFRGHYPLTHDEREHLWQNATFVLDSNVLLALYDFGDSARTSYIEGLKSVADRLWMPHQVGTEFHRNRRRVAKDATTPHASATKALEDAVKTAAREVKRLGARDELLQADAHLVALEEAVSKVKEALDDSRKRFETERAGNRDAVLDELDQLYTDERVGKPFSPKRLTKERARAELRIVEKIPPGFSDVDKVGDAAFGDQFLWVQTMRQAKRSRRGVILVTDDSTKDDWSRGGRPLPELLTEFYRNTGELVDVIDSAAFYRGVTKRFATVEQATVDEVTREIATAATHARVHVPNVSFFPPPPPPVFLSPGVLEGMQKAFAVVAKNRGVVPTIKLPTNWPALNLSTDSLANITAAIQTLAVAASLVAEAEQLEEVDLDDGDDELEEPIHAADSNIELDVDPPSQEE
ncbi:PIN domain-containing protein [Leifsonia sp. Leaf264]|uniref:PIN domain-containing protein n=1 Tax=Leifsonia sp. Leaf264 TaxID=1736314 RepID=UPI000700C220|nr:PIN domain-containing protein [Leifsonia sp. Leaf264]KQP01416.1 hypothetical protein ASF30_02020 [Leifsonia sp. Leaf264]